jgi:DNA-binding FadR family transcriptional regulator
LTAQLRKHIIQKGLKPGDPLLTEQEMMAKFGVSRSVVREATKALDFLGIIEAVPSRGMVLNDFNFDRASEYFGFHFALSDYPREQLYEARMVLETGALYYTMRAMKRDPALYGALHRLAKSAPDGDLPDAWIEYDIAFHRRLVEASGIAPLASFSDLLQAFFQESRGALVVSRNVRDMHIQIIEALHLEKLEVATHLLRDHTLWKNGHDGASAPNPTPD